MARFSLDLRELEAAKVLNTLSEIPETQVRHSGHYGWVIDRLGGYLR